MSIGRPAIIVGQAIVVGVLVVVVYLTLLRPEDESTLSRVDAPGGAQITQQPVNPSDRDDGPGGGERGRDGGGGGGGGGGRGPGGGSDLVGSAFVPATAGAGAEALPVAPVAPPAGPEAEPESPASDQYQNAVSRLTERLR
jgi:hypothetical protein